MKSTPFPAVLTVAVCLVHLNSAAEETWTGLVDPNLSQWELWMGVPHTSVKDLPEGTPQDDKNKNKPLGLANDPKKVFSVIEEDGKLVLKITGEIYGGLTTLKEYGNYHFSCEVRFGDKKWEPRLDRQRDSGVLYHCGGEHGAFWNVWMRSLEYQVQEENLGDLYLLAGTAADVPTSPNTVKVPGVPAVRWDPTKPFKPANGAERSTNHENPHGEWTKAEFYVLGQQAIHLVNGNVVLSLDKARLKDGTPLTKGKLQIQSEGAEVYYRNMRIAPITAFPADLAKKAAFPAGRESNVSSNRNDDLVSLFDGSTLKGWIHAHGPDIPAPYAGGEWKVTDGAITGNQKPRGVGSFLHTEARHADFELELDVNPDWGCDSGIWIRTDPTGKCIPVFMDYLDGGNVGFLYGQGTGGYASMPWQLSAERDGDKIVDVKAVDHYDGVAVDGLLYSAKAEEFNRVWKHGEFNTLRIRCTGTDPHITTWVNGVKMMEMDGSTFRARGLNDVRAGKLDAAPRWNSEKFNEISGTIGLQVHPGPRWNGTVRYKNIRIRELSND